VAPDKIQVVQPEVSRHKFDRELDEFRLIEDDWRRKGVICLKAEFPKVQLAFTAHQLKPPPIVFGVSLDFTNYDIEPPSIKFIDPLSGRPITTKEMNVNFFQVSTAVQSLPGMPQLQFQRNRPVNCIFTW